MIGLLWQLASWITPNAEIFLPGPIKVAGSLKEMFISQAFLRDVLVSIYRVTLGFGLAFLVAYPIGIMAGVSKTVQAMTQPLNDFARYLPVAAFIPLVILWAGIGNFQKIAIIFLGTVFQLIPLISDTAARVPKNLIELGKTLGFGTVKTVTHVIVPWSAPVIYDHSRVAMGWAWSYLIVAELVAANIGIGHVIIQAQRFIQTANVIAAIIVVGILGLLFDLMFRLPKNKIFPWQSRL